MQIFSFFVLIFVSLFVLNSQASTIGTLHIKEPKYKGVNPSDKTRVKEMKKYIGNKYMNEGNLDHLVVGVLFVNKVYYGSLIAQTTRFDPQNIPFGGTIGMTSGYPISGDAVEDTASEPQAKQAKMLSSLDDDSSNSSSSGTVVITNLKNKNKSSTKKSVSTTVSAINNCTIGEAANVRFGDIICAHTATSNDFGMSPKGTNKVYPKKSNNQVQESVINSPVVGISFGGNVDVNEIIRRNQERVSNFTKAHKSKGFRLNKTTFKTSKAVISDGHMEIHAYASSIPNGGTKKFTDEVEVTNIDNLLYFTIYGEGKFDTVRDPADADTITIKLY